MIDMTQTIIAKSDQLNADDLIGRELTIKITKIVMTGTEQPVAIHFEGDNNKPYMACKSMRRCLVHVWGPDANAYIGRSLTLYRDPGVKFGGLEVGGIRISAMSHIDRDMVMALTMTKANKKPYRVRPLVVDQPKPEPAKLSAAEEWFTGFSGALDAATTPEAVDAILASPRVRKALDVGSAEGKARINELARAALERVAPVIVPAMADDDGWMA